MSYIGRRDNGIEGGNNPFDGYRDHPQSMQNQPSQGQSNFGDSSEPLFSIYSKAADDEDDKMVESWQKDADGILFFTGLFSAAVAALLSVTVQDLRPNSQDTSAFHLGNIYEVLTDPNTTRASTPSRVVKPPAFSPPRYAIWVNSLWFLSLVISLTCALLATSLQQWARRYIRLTQPALCSPKKRARMHAFFAEGADKMHIPWAVEGLPAMLHLSLFLFFAGLVVFLVNTHHTVFISVAWWIGLSTVLYGCITVISIVRHDSPYCAPLSRLAWFLYAGMRLVFIKVLASDSIRSGDEDARRRFQILKDRYRGWMSGGVEKAAEEMMSERSSKTDIRIFDWTFKALDDDDELEKFFEAIPGFFNSDPVQNLERDFPETLLEAFWAALDGFMGRTSSNSVKDTAKARRAITCRDIMSMIPYPSHYMNVNLDHHFDRAPISIERLQAMARWRTHSSDDVSYAAQARVAKSLPRIQQRDDRWIELAGDVYGLSQSDLQDKVNLGGDNVLLSTLIDLCHLAIKARFRDWEVLTAFTQFDIRNTFSGLQHDFCTMWNEVAQEARKKGPFSTPIDILHRIRYLYIALHQGTSAAPTAFSAFTDDFAYALFRPLSYPLCNISDHRPSSTTPIPVTNSLTVPFRTRLGDSPFAPPHRPTVGGSSDTPLRLAEATNVIVGPPWPSDRTTASEIGESSQASVATSPASPVHTSPRHPNASPPGAIAAARQTIFPIATSYPLGGTTQRDIVAPFAEPDVGEIPSTGPTPTSMPMPMPAFAPPVLNESLASWDAGPAYSSNFLFPAPSVVGVTIPDSRTPSRVPPLQFANLIALLSGTTPSDPINGDTLPRLRARGLVNSGSNRHLNAMLQLLAHCPLFWNLFRDLGKLMGRQGLGEGLETGGGATPLVNVMVKFLDEFVYKGEASVSQPLPQKTAKGKARENEEGKKEHNVVDSFNPGYIYDAMQEKRQLKNLLDGQQQDAAEFFRLYLDALDEELLELLASIIGRKSVTVALGVEEREVPQSGPTDEGKHSLTVESVELPLMRIFGGRSRSTVRAPNQPDAVTTQDWRLLQLNIQPDSVNTVKDALAHISQPQPVQVGHLSPSDVSEQVQIEALPSVLVLHLKRFLYDAAADGIVKISKPVRFAPELEIPLEIMAPVAGKPVEPAHYKLYGVLYHHGDTAGSGHYTVDVLHRSGDSGGGEAWLHIDDETVSALQHGDVFGGHGNEWGDDQCAYMLFYCRTALTQT